MVLNHRIGGDDEEEFTATPSSCDNRHEQIGMPWTVKSYIHYSLPGRSGKYSDFQRHWFHFTACDYDANNPDQHDHVLLFEGKSFDDDVDMEKGSFD